MKHTGDGLRYRLKAIGGQGLVQREDGVQHSLAAKAARSKLLKTCGKCCCISHCLLACHIDGNASEFERNWFQEEEMVHSKLLDRSWMDNYQFEQEMMESVVTEHDDMTGLLCAVNTDLTGVNMDLLA